MEVIQVELTNSWHLLDFFFFSLFCREIFAAELPPEPPAA
jgi:hypothetical protein